MCGLCGILNSEVHWADHDVAVGSPETLLGRRERSRRVQFLNRLLRPYACSLSEWQGSSFVLSSFTGKAEIINSLSELWLHVEKFSGIPVDPLGDDIVRASSSPS